jgi:hypothetical protein
MIKLLTFNQITFVISCLSGFFQVVIGHLSKISCWFSVALGIKQARDMLRNSSLNAKLT